MKPDKRFYGSLAALAFIVMAGLVIQWKYMDEYPSHIHAWAEQDHYALALGFINNGFDLFHPETMIYNKQFPNLWKEASDSTITPAGFPIHEYIVALLMKLLGTTSPWVFRLWTLLWGFLGLFFLFKIAFRITDDWLKSALVTSIALTSPVFAYFLNGFLPSIPSLAFGIIGLWHYLKYYDGKSRKHFHLSIAFLTVAMLMRTTFAIELIALLCFELLRVFRKESTLADKLPTVVLSFSIFLAYSLWNKHLQELYGTLFLNQLLPPEDWQDAKELIADTFHKWTFEYFQKIHYVLFLLITMASIGITLWKSNKKEENAVTSQPEKTLSLWWLPLIEIFGCLLFSVAMMQQLPFHDYYLIDTYFLPILLVITLALNALPKWEDKKTWNLAGVVLAVICSIMIVNVRTSQTDRRERETQGLISYVNYQDSDLLLDSLDIPRDAKILCLYGFAQNGPFIQMKRKGYTVMTDDEDLINAAFTWDFDYIVIENGQFAKHLETRREILSKLKKIGGNKHISVCTPTNNWIYQKDWQFFYPTE